MEKSALKKRYTRFRAYQLGNPGSSFSYFDGTSFTLIEARFNDVNGLRIIEEMNACGTSTLSNLHITSWDNDHCDKAELEEILDKLQPSKIEYPGYAPHCPNAEDCLKLVKSYKKENPSKTIRSIDPDYIESLDNAERWAYSNIIYHPKYLSKEYNNNSTVKLFRTGMFNVASLGDVEDHNISSYLRSRFSFYSEVDVMILAHHGADNGFSSVAFFKKVMPSVAICSSDYDNQFEHPKQEIRHMLNKFEIPIYTTKTGDVVIVSIEPNNKKYRVFNLKADSNELSSVRDFISKKSHSLSNNMDTVRNIYQGRHKPFYKFK